ncbi:MAG: 3-dehydroquinate synthase [Bacteroidales bacterium]|nr:3-dehydroquinate synthase [Bacteroidales bacterium]
MVVKCIDIKAALKEFFAAFAFDKYFLLTDEHVKEACLPLLKGVKEIDEACIISIPSGDNHKNMESLARVWTILSESQATRHSLFISMGGGMITDLGGFAAATFKRGMVNVNIPTTLLGAVDAAVGGKTGINFNGLKNEIGSFALPLRVFIDSVFYKTLPKGELLSGYAEMLKHGLLSHKEDLAALLSFDFGNIDYVLLGDMAVRSVYVKEDIVKQDPQEKGIRKALNLGHTIGHAFESLSHQLKAPIPHGYAVAWGLICELYLSHKKLNFPSGTLHQVVHYIREYYGVYSFDCKQYETLYAFMLHDKKNSSGHINFTFLKDVGDVMIDCHVQKDEIFEALDFYRESFGI